MTHLTLQAVTKRFNAAYAVDHVDLSVPDGKLVCFLGPSGCGKTTLLRMIAGLETPSSGSVNFAGRDITHLPANRRDFGMVFQSLALFPHMTVAENVAYPLRLRKTDKAAQSRRVTELLELIQLPHMANRPVTQLSRAQSHRNRNCCCSTNRSPRSMPSCAKRCRWKSACCNSVSASRQSWSRTTSARQ
jgi:putative spermidine/putrescine transport system ATP-binding protein